MLQSLPYKHKREENVQKSSKQGWLAGLVGALHYPEKTRSRNKKSPGNKNLAEETDYLSSIGIGGASLILATGNSVLDYFSQCVRVVRNWTPYGCVCVTRYIGTPL